MENHNSMLSKALVIGIIILFIGMGVNPSTGIIVKKKYFNETKLYFKSMTNQVETATFKDGST